MSNICFPSVKLFVQAFDAGTDDPDDISAVGFGDALE